MKRLRRWALLVVLVWLGAGVVAVLLLRRDPPASPPPVVVITAPATSTAPPPTVEPGHDPLRLDTDGNGRLSCAEVYPRTIHRGDPEYSYMIDSDNDGTVCE